MPKRLTGLMLGTENSYSGILCTSRERTSVLETFWRRYQERSPRNGGGLVEGVLESDCGSSGGVCQGECKCVQNYGYEVHGCGDPIIVDD